MVPKLAPGGWGKGGIAHWACAKALRRDTTCHFVTIVDSVAEAWGIGEKTVQYEG